MIDEEGEYTDTAFANTGDLGPEGLVFIAAEDSPVEAPMLLIANEVSGTLTACRIDIQ